MKKSIRRAILTLTAAASFAAFSGAATLTDNLSKTTTDTEFVGGSTWIAGAFGTDGSSYRISTATLLLAATPASSTAKLDLYSSLSGQPNQLLTTLTSPGSFTSTASMTNFTGSSYILSPNSTYWLVLKAPTGSFDWSWTEDNTGAGVGFLSQWAATDDAGSSWFPSDTEPMQFRVLADPVSPAIPEPQSILLAACGLLLMIGVLRTRRSA